MADSEISKSPQATPPRQSGRQPDVFGAMRDEVDRMFERFERGWPMLPGLLQRAGVTGTRGGAPALDVRDEGDTIVIEADLPGCEEKDVDVTLADGILTIKGEKKSERKEEKDNYYMNERSYGSFQRSIALPDTIDEEKVAAEFDKGVLKIVAPKRPEAVKAERKIEISKKG